MMDTVFHAIDALDSLGEGYGYVALLQPTSPLRTAAHIDEAVGLMRSSKAQGVVSVCPAEHSPLWMNTLPADGRLGGFLGPAARAHGRQTHFLSTID